MAEDTRGWQIFHAANWKFEILNAETPADRRERILERYVATRCPFERRRLRRQWMEAGGNELIRAALLATAPKR